jgi:hypothetical protein
MKLREHTLVHCPSVLSARWGKTLEFFSGVGKEGAKYHQQYA